MTVASEQDLKNVREVSACPEDHVITLLVRPDWLPLMDGEPDIAAVYRHEQARGDGQRYAALVPIEHYQWELIHNGDDDAAAIIEGLRDEAHRVTEKGSIFQ